MLSCILLLKNTLILHLAVHSAREADDAVAVRLQY